MQNLEVEISLARKYQVMGTNGTLEINGQQICKSIELPWRNNKRSVSCIPEGRYTLKLIQSRMFGKVLQLIDVPQRDQILIHPANQAAQELRGCIAPVMVHTGAGMGLGSRRAMQQLMNIAELYLQKNARLVIFIH